MVQLPIFHHDFTIDSLEDHILLIEAGAEFPEPKSMVLSESPSLSS